jgi:triacylglycerol lipase
MKKIVFFVIICFLFLFFLEFTPAEKTAKTELEQNEKIELKYPVVLVHGIARNDNRKRQTQNWGRIPETLRENNIQVYFGNTDAWGEISSNSELLKKTIDTIIKETGHERVNIIAHSKGGIDSRFCIWRYDYGNRVASLTTIATPHQGSEIADLFFNTKIIHTKSVKKRLKAIGKLFGDVNPDIYSVNAELTTENMKEFSANITMDHRVYYQSIYSTLREPSDDPIFSFSHAYMNKLGNESDGLVSESSARWGQNSTKLQNSISHEQIVDRGGKRIHGMEIPNLYLEIVRGLSKKGF